jgi:hypothetical protein
MTTINQSMKNKMNEHYQLLKNQHQKLIERKKLNIDDKNYITNQIKCMKGRIEIYAGLFNGNIELYDNGLDRFKTYGLLILDFLGETEKPTNMIIISQNQQSQNEKRRFDRDILHRNNEAYRQYALFLQDKTEYYTSLRKYLN